MKYIRTKDGIHETIIYVVESKEKYYWLCVGGDRISPKEILKKADTVEELCDEFVIALGNRTHRFIRSLSGKGKGGITWYRQRNYKIVAVYGAIWTDKGLIYVAKMNDKGELELL